MCAALPPYEWGPLGAISVARQPPTLPYKPQRIFNKEAERDLTQNPQNDFGSIIRYWRPPNETTKRTFDCDSRRQHVRVLKKKSTNGAPPGRLLPVVL